MSIKINFCDFWPGFEDNNLFLQFLEKHYDVRVADEPDYLFFSVYGNKHLQFNNTIKIFFNGENTVPDFNLCDYALGFHYLDFEDRYMRFPLYVYYHWYYQDYFGNFHRSIRNENQENLTNRKFCNFVYSNNLNSDPIRDRFFYRLNSYKKVDSGGKHLNNIGQPVPNKLNFIKDYKFTIAFENSSVTGYTTEKILEPFLAKSIPIYYGNPIVNKDFCTDSFIEVKGSEDIETAVKEIILLDNDDSLYLKKLNAPFLLHQKSLSDWEQKLLSFTNNIFSQSLYSARRRALHGYSLHYLKEVQLLSDLLKRKKKLNSLKSSMKTILRKASR